MDKFKIEFKCVKEPKSHSGLDGFQIDKVYKGRSFNGLFEVTPKWGNGEPTKVIETSLFKQYFEILN
ncbi:MAG: hypothetical protein AAF363_13195 [Bacteroidota bacterium]